MKQRYGLSLIAVCFLSGQAFANDNPTVNNDMTGTDSALPQVDAQKKQIPTSNATGADKTTVVDENGNLQIVDSPKTPANSETNLPATSAPKPTTPGMMPGAPTTVPVKPVTPAQPTTPKPAQPVTPTPAQPVTPTPQQPITPTPTQPIAPVPEQPMQPAMPTDPMPTTPMEKIN